MLIVAFTAVKSNKGKRFVRTIKHSVNKMSILFALFLFSRPVFYAKLSLG